MIGQVSLWNGNQRLSSLVCNTFNISYIQIYGLWAIWKRPIKKICNKVAIIPMSTNVLPSAICRHTLHLAPNNSNSKSLALILILTSDIPSINLLGGKTIGSFQILGSRAIPQVFIKVGVPLNMSYPNSLKSFSLIQENTHGAIEWRWKFSLMMDYRYLRLGTSSSTLQDFPTTVSSSTWASFTTLEFLIDSIIAHLIVSKEKN